MWKLNQKTILQLKNKKNDLFWQRFNMFAEGANTPTALDYYESFCFYCSSEIHNNGIPTN